MGLGFGAGGVPGCIRRHLLVDRHTGKRRHGKLMQPAASDRKTAWRLIRGPWPLVWGAVALVVLNFATLALSGRPWSITSAFALWGAKALDHFGSDVAFRSEEHTSELQSLMRISYAVFCLKKKKHNYTYI